MNHAQRTLQRRVMRGLAICAEEPEWLEDCEKRGCPYLDVEDGNCITRLCREALQLIAIMDTLMQGQAKEATTDDP